MQTLTQITNWYLPNLSFILHKKIKLSGNVPLCDQFTKVSGEGQLLIAENCRFGYRLGGRHRGGSIEIQPRYLNAEIVIGANVFFNNNVFICAANFIEIGAETRIGEGVTMMDHEAHETDPLKRDQVGVIGTIKIGKNVWIGNGVTILKNSVIGDNTIVAAGTIVAGVFEANTIIGGIPAKLIRPL